MLVLSFCLIRSIPFQYEESSAREPLFRQDQKRNESFLVLIPPQTHSHLPDPLDHETPLQ